uniref:HECT-type E3 ubiquitin transferase n=1 Tax=Heterosigma akashiwo TaxID=2829 RepID=A0A7S3XRI8_HETAK
MEKKYKQVSLKAQELEDKLNTLRNDNETLKNTLAEAEQQRKDALQNDFRAETSGMTEDAMTVQEKLQKEEEARSLKWELKVQFSDQILDYFNKYRQFHRVFDTLKKLGHKIDLREHGIRTEVKVDRAFVVRDVLRCKHFRSAALDGLDAVLGDIQVEFVASSLRRGGKRSVEDGMDAGGLTKELNTLFWKELEHYEYEDKEMRKKIRLFSKENPESSVVLPTKFQDHRGNPCKISLEMQTYYKVVGIMMSRAFLGGMPIPRQYLNSTVLDYLLGFERANTEARKGLSELLEDLLAVDPEYKWVQTIVQDIQNGDKEKTVNDVLHDENMTTLSEENCYEVIKTFIYERIVRPREASLQFIADGFTIRKGGADTPKLPVLTSFIELCSCTKERQTLLCGNEDLKASDLINVMEFKGYRSKADKAKYKGWLGEILEEMTVEQRQQILQFCTGARSLSSEPGFTITVQKGGAGSAGSSTSAGSSGPSAADPSIPSAATATPGGGGGRSGGDGGRVSAARLPEAQTCTDMLRLPLYESKNEMRFKLLGALSNGGLEYFGKK